MEFPSQKKKNYSELEIQYAWNLLKQGTFFTSILGMGIEILYPGRWNFESGPDFLNAKVKVNGTELSGDVEIHNTPLDWFLHGHDSDAKYNNVILHIVKTSPYSYSDITKYPAIPTIIFPDSYLPVFNHWRKNVCIEKYSRGLCADLIKHLEPEQLSGLLSNFGECRFKKKAIIFINEILTNGSEQVFLMHLFESFGYKNNRQAFLNLYKRFSKYNISVYNDLKFEAIIWGESGFLFSKGIFKSDNDLHDYVSNLWNYWWKVKRHMENLPEIIWSKVAGRPCNFPWRRVAGLIILLRKLFPSPLTYLLTIFKQNMSTEEIINELINIFFCEDEVLGKYLNFNKKLKTVVSLVGKGRAIEIIGNIVIPFFYAYSKINKDSFLEKRISEIWKELPSSKNNNIALRISCERWGISKSIVKAVVKSFPVEQGIIFMYKNLCEYLQMNCKECPVFSSFKNKGKV